MALGPSQINMLFASKRKSNKFPIMQLTLCTGSQAINNQKNLIHYMMLFSDNFKTYFQIFVVHLALDAFFEKAIARFN